MKDIHNRFFVLILVLLAGSIWAIVSKPTRMGLDIQGGMRVVLRAKKEELKKGKQWNADSLNTVASIIRQRVDSLGVSEPVIYTRPTEDQIVVELPGLTNKQQALEVIQSTAKLEFRYVEQLADNTWRTQESTDGEEIGYEKIIGSDGKPVPEAELEAKVFSKDPILSGDDLLPNAKADIGMGRPVIHFEFKDDAKRVFEEFTRSHIGKPLAIFLDKKLISAPNIKDVIPGTGIIEGQFTPQAARTLAGQLNAGALPVPLQQEQITNVEATLGRQAVHQTLIAGIIGLSLVLLFMLAYYRVPGLLADIALILYACFSLAIFKLVPVTLTVPGIAGFILSIGMAVDANILIFERMKEERLSGKSLHASIEAGFRRAFTAIFDSNVCTLITCAILYNFGAGPVRGFALTLAIGVIVSMFTAITVSRTFIMMLTSTEFGQNDHLYALQKGLHPHLNVSKRMALWFAISGLVIIPGLVFWGVGGIKPSIEFTGGTEVTAQFTRATTARQINEVLARLGHRETRVVMAEGGTRAYINTRRLSDAERTAIIDALRTDVSPIQTETVTDPATKQPVTQEVVNYSNVSGAISKELTRNAFLSVLYASVLIIVYLAFRFSIPSFMEGLKYGTCAVIALLHDVLVVWGVMAFFGWLLNWQIDSLFVTALLTVIGFSVHDTIIIFDRIRENLRYKARGETFAEVADRSIEQTFSRSIYTTGTVLLTLLALIIWGGPTILTFVAILFIGIASGAYSSIFNATPLLVLWKRLTGTDRALAAAGGAAVQRAPAAPARRPEPVRPRQAAAPAAAKPATVTGPAGPAGPAAQAPLGTDGTVDVGQRLKPKKRKRRM